MKRLIFLAVAGIAATLCADEKAASIDGLLEPVPGPRASVSPAAGKLDRVVKRLTSDAQRHVLNGETLLGEIEKDLAARFGVSGELKLSLIRPWVAVDLPAEDFSVVVTEAPSEGLSSSFLVRVKVTSAAQTIGEWPVAVRAQLFQEMWAASGRIERGQPLDRSLLTAQKVDVLRERGALLPADLEPSSFETIQTVPSPRLLVRRDVMERPIVRKGQVVEVVAGQGLLALTMKALALEGGSMGALIKLRNLESRKEFAGQIIHENQVRVQF